MIHRNRHPTGCVSNMVFGLCAIADGLVRVFSLGLLHTNLCLAYSKRQARLAHQGNPSKSSDFA